MDAKQQVEDYLKTDRSLLGGRNLYNQLPGKSRAFQNTLARYTNTKPNLDKLYYQLAKLAGISEYQLKIILQKPVKKATTKKNTSKDKSKTINTLKDKLKGLNFDNNDDVEKAIIELEQFSKYQELVPNSIPDFSEDNEIGLEERKAYLKYLECDNLDGDNNTLDTRIKEYYDKRLAEAKSEAIFNLYMAQEELVKEPEDTEKKK
jgi:hypothetical protein